MANNKDNENGFRNEDTLVRRAWIESALEGVRARMAEPQPVAETSNLALDDAAGNDDGPGLYLAWSADERRSGT